MSEIRDVFVETSFGRLHAIYGNSKAKGIPMVFIPGMLGKAEDWQNDFASFSEHPCVAISLRGRGQSDFPASGFSVYDHANDIQAVVEHLGIRRFVLVGFSQGALYAVAYALTHPESIVALVIQDKVLKQRKFGKEWVERARTHPSAKSEQFLWGIANDSQDLNLLEECRRFAKTPTLILKGGHSAMMMDEDLIEMKDVFKNSKIEIFPLSGHDVSSPDYDLYVRTMRSFLKKLSQSH